MTVIEYEEIRSGTCTSRGGRDIKTRNECNEAAAALNQYDKYASYYSSYYQPQYCYRYYSGYNGLRFNSIRSGRSCSYYYRCLCIKAASPPPAPSFPPLPDGNPLFTTSSASKCVVSARGICACSSNYNAQSCDSGSTDGIGTYGGSQDCTFSLDRGGFLRSEYFFTEATYDTLEVDGVKYSNRKGPYGQTSGPLRWRSDGSTNKAGFRLCIGTSASPPPPPPSPPTPPSSPPLPPMPPLAPGERYVSSFDDLPAAIAAAAANDVLRLTEGTFQPAAETDNALVINKDITLRATGAVLFDGQNTRRMIKVAANSKVTLEGITITNCKASLQGSAVLVDAGAELTFIGGTITGCNRAATGSADVDGGVVHLAANAKATLTSMRLDKAAITADSGAIKGGLISLASGSELTLTAAVISEVAVSASSSGTVYGGLLYVASSAKVTESTSSIEGISATSSSGPVYGGLAYVLGTATLSSTTASGVRASSSSSYVHGGLLCVGDGGTATLASVSTTGSVAGSASGGIQGGLVEALSGGTAYLTSCSFASAYAVAETAVISGSLVYVETGATTHVTSCTSTNATTVSDSGVVNGGVLYLGGVDGGVNGTAEVYDCQFDNTDVRSDSGRVHGGVVFFAAKSKAKVIGTSVTNSTVSTDSGTINGGVVHVWKDANPMLERTTLFKARITAGTGDIMGGCISATQGRLSLDMTTVAGCRSKSASGKVQGGGALLSASAVLVMSNTTLFKDNSVADTELATCRGQKSCKGHTLYVAGATAVYMLPAPAGRWIAGNMCVVNRKACAQTEDGKIIDNNCGNTVAACRQLASATGTVSCSQSTCTLSSVSCQPTLSFQACDWYSMPELVGQVVDMLPQGAVDLDYPYACSAGILGSANPKDQSTALCGGLTPTGTYQPVAAGTVQVPCPPGYYCPSGSASAVPCPAGTYSEGKDQNGDSMTLGAASECTQCEAGSECPPGGITTPIPCAAGHFSAVTGQAKCTRCFAGTFQDAGGATGCRNCTEGYYCPAGAAAALPCPGGTHMNASLSVMTDVNQCIDCDLGTFCSVGSKEPTPCAPGTFNDKNRSSTCKNCPSGTFQDVVGSTSCKQCTEGYYCAAGAASALPCPGGTHANQTALNITGYLMGVHECITCPAGTSCAVGSNKPKDCMPGSFAASESSEACDLCPAGKYVSRMGQTACLVCPRGFYCEQGAATPIPCPGGTSSNVTSATARSTCKQVVLGEWAPLGNALPEPCPTSGFYCPGAANDVINAVPGSKPIIIPVGDNAITKDVETVKKTLTLDLSCNDFDLTKIKQSLATKYSVNVALVSLNNPCIRRRAEEVVGAPPNRHSLPVSDYALPAPDYALPAPAFAVEGADAFVASWLAAEQPSEGTPLEEAADDASRGRSLQSGGMTLSLVIATEATAADGSTVTASADSLVTTIQGVSDSDLGSTLGTALGTSVSVTSSSSPTKATQAMTVKMVCPKGKWCTAGLVVDCTVGTYNDLMGQNLGTACKRCPEFSTSPAASTKIQDCVCEDGFLAIPQPDGSVSCECDVGMEIMNGARCDKCSLGTYKSSPGNIKCTDCRSSPIKLAAKENTITAARGAVNASQCVCKAGYYMFADEITGQQVCRLCSNT